MKVIVSKSHAGKVLELTTKVFGENAEIILAGGAGYKSLRVAQRNANAYIHTTAIKKWDICAGNALLNTVGGRMTDLSGIEIDYSYPKSYHSGVKLNGGLLGTYKDHFSILMRLKKIEKKTEKPN